MTVETAFRKLEPFTRYLCTSSADKDIRETFWTSQKGKINL